MKTLLYFITYICLLSSVAVSIANGKDELQPVTLQLKWFNQFQFAGYYAALHQGFYHEEGLDVVIKPGGPNINVDEEVLSGRANFGVLASELIAMRTSGKPLVLLAVIMQHSTRAIIVRAESGINSPADLIGKQLMINFNEDAEFKAMFAAEGISYEKLTIVAKDKTSNSKFIEGTIDGLNGSIGNQPYTFSSSNIAVKTIRPISYGLDFYGDSVFTSENYLKEHPKQVEKFRRATLKGWEYAMSNVEEMVDLIITEYSPRNSREHLLFEAKALRELILPDLVDIGHISLLRIDRIANLYTELDLVPENYSLEGFIYNPNGESLYIRRVVFILSIVVMVVSVFGILLVLFNYRLKKTVAEQTEGLRSSNSLLKAVIEGTTDAIFLKNLRGQYLLANSSTLKAIGKTEHEVIGKDDSELFPEKSAEAINAVDSSVMQSGQPRFAEELLETTDGVSYWLANKSPHRDAAGNIIGLIGISRDISDQKRIEGEKKKLQEQLMQAQKMESIGNLSGGIAHEFNNILAIIIGNNELIMEDLPESSLAKENAEEIQIAGIRARDMVKQLLTFSRQDSAAQKIIDIRSVVQESMNLIRSSIPTNIEIKQTLADNIYPVMANTTQINQVILNLCKNAVDALPNMGGILTVDLSNTNVDTKHSKPHPAMKCGQYVKLVVNDNGIGMDEKTLNRMFDPYYTTKPVGKGTGIGMAVVHGIIKKHGGLIIADSHPGQGTTITIFFPAHEDNIKPETEDQNILPTGDGHILYVDDEPSIAKLGKCHLDSLGYTTESITDPSKALEMVRSAPGKFDLVITDMAMPNMTGDQLVIEILNIRQDMPTIICTGYSANISDKEATKIGVSAFIMKPLNKCELANIVWKVLNDARRTDYSNH